MRGETKVRHTRVSSSPRPRGGACWGRPWRWGSSGRCRGRRGRPPRCGSRGARGGGGGARCPRRRRRPRRRARRRWGRLGEELREAEGLGGGDERGPVDLGEHAAEELRVGLRLLGRPLHHLQLQRVARHRAPRVRRQHVVRQEPHLPRPRIRPRSPLLLLTPPAAVAAAVAAAAV